MKSETPEKASIAASDYTQEYYETCCQGFEEFSGSLGTNLPERLSIPLELAELKAGYRIVDVGCGRGEIVLNAARRGAFAWGLDYAKPALEIAQNALESVATPDEHQVIFLTQSNARQLPFASNSIDVVFMLDVVEHLYPYELEETFLEILRILRSGGRLVIHTMPNLWYYHWGYPVYRFIQALRGKKLPKNPRERWAYHHVHVNEQTPTALSKTLRKCGFETRVWLQTTQNYDYEENQWVRKGMNFLTTTYPFRWVYCNDIFAIGTKP